MRRHRNTVSVKVERSKIRKPRFRVQPDPRTDRIRVVKTVHGLLWYEYGYADPLASLDYATLTFVWSGGNNNLRKLILAQAKQFEIGRPFLAPRGTIRLGYALN